jgi:hypothetical protein
MLFEHQRTRKFVRIGTMTTTAVMAAPYDEFDEDDPLLPTRTIKAEFDICDMTIWRWERDGLLPAATRINRRKYYPRSAVRRLKRQGRATA